MAFLLCFLISISTPITFLFVFLAPVFFFFLPFLLPVASSTCSLFPFSCHPSKSASVVFCLSPTPRSFQTSARAATELEGPPRWCRCRSALGRGSPCLGGKRRLAQRPAEQKRSISGRRRRECPSSHRGSRCLPNLSPSRFHIWEVQVLAVLVRVDGGVAGSRNEVVQVV